jgi:hypothetical protein
MLSWILITFFIIKDTMTQTMYEHANK